MELLLVASDWNSGDWIFIYGRFFSPQSGVLDPVHYKILSCGRTCKRIHLKKCCSSFSDY